MHRRPNEILIIGPGRLGSALGLELLRSGLAGKVICSGRRPFPPDHPLLDVDGVEVLKDEQRLPRSLSAVLIAVPDRAIESVAAFLAQQRFNQVPVLHTSGALGADALGVLAESCPIGSLHPLVSVADPSRDAAKLRGAWFGIEGTGGAREVAEQIVAAFGGRSLRIKAGAKPLYHAAAVFASNYVVAVLGAAERLMSGADVPPELSRQALACLAAGVLRNTVESGPAQALTGPVARGDAATVELHLERLSPADRQLYSVLAGEALSIARDAGLSEELAVQLKHLLQRGAP